MRLADLATRMLRLSEVLHGWLELLTGLEASRRQRISLYADAIAATLGRAADALTLLESSGDRKRAARQAARELGRISGYVEDILGLLEDHVDGRKLRGVKRRLDRLAAADLDSAAAPTMLRSRLQRLSEAEGYFRALADGLRV